MSNTSTTKTKLKPTPEQDAIYTLPQRVDGFYLVVANAGSGKTTACAELVVRIYLAEEAKLYPRAGHVTGDEQLRLLRLFLVLSFTRKAAQELDERIRELFRERGIPIPMSHGKPARICRTLDSALQQWLKLRSFYEVWAKNVPSFPRAHARLRSMLRPELRAELEKGDTSGVEFFRKWGGLLTGAAQVAFVDALRCNANRTPALEGASLEQVRSSLDSFVAGATTIEALAAPPVLAELHHAYTSRNAHFHAIEHNHARKMTVEQAAELTLWRERRDYLAGFLTAFDFARSRGWDPLAGPAMLNRKDILNAVAGSGVITSIKDFYTLAVSYQRAKEELGLMDHGDYLATFVRVVSTREGSALLERSREYPARGIRRKYVINDENQDYNSPQFVIQKKFTAEAGVPYLSLGVGDPFQSLYEFRGSSPIQFIRGVERLREDRPNHLLTLSCCFRSGRAIVALGNEILQTLSRYGGTASPSRTVKDFDGEIAIPPPFPDAETEASFILDQLAPRVAGGETAMVLMRANTSHHPVTKAIEAAGLTDKIQLMTVHGAKGLEADNVIVAGMNAGAFPDVRCSFEQEVNLLYVAATRARRRLTLTCHSLTHTVDKHGNVKEEHSSPSPFFGDVPTLRAIATKSGWSAGLFADGRAAHRQAQAVQIEQREMRLHAYREELKRFAPPDAQPAEDEPSEPQYRGARSSTFAVEPSSSSEPDLAPAIPTPAVIDACRKVFIRGGKPNSLKASDRLAATRLGWIVFRDGGPAFSPALLEVLKTAR